MLTEDFCVHVNDVCRKAVDTFGWEMQSLIAVEEMAELQKEIVKRHRGMQNDMRLAEEVADVMVTLLQLVYMFDLQDAVDEQIAFKADRLERKIEGRA